MQAASLNAAEFEETDCTFEMPQGMPERIKVRCGTLTVPEDRSQTDGKKIRLAAAIFPSPAESPQPDPVLILMTGGGAFLQFSPFMTFLYNGIYEERDLIMLELRGAGYSEPALGCPGLNELFYDSLDQDPLSNEARGQAVDLRRTCRQAWEAEDIQISAYTTAASAEDLNDLRLALGYREWNVVANGSGTRIAFEMARAHPEGLRSLILDTPIPPQASYLLESAKNARRALDLLFKRCAEDTRCKEAFPDLEADFYDLVDQLNAAPVVVEIPDLNSGQRVNFLLTGDRLLEAILIGLNLPFDDSVIPELPRMISQLKEGRYDALKTVMGTIIPNIAPNDEGMPDLLFCNEQFLQNSDEIIRQAVGAGGSQLEGYFSRQLDLYAGVCEILEFPEPPDGLNEPITSSVPAMFMAGDFTSDVPPAWASLAASGFSRSYTVEFSGAGPFVAASSAYGDCSENIMKAFLANPQSQPDFACASAKKSFLWITLP
jgi:pimeloyl-ACP methyl ester carboxylesterase